eukprot:m51a1_g12764 hypothetical protein (143) ;mRNA; f:33-569
MTASDHAAPRDCASRARLRSGLSSPRSLRWRASRSASSRSWRIFLASARSTSACSLSSRCSRIASRYRALYSSSRSATVLRRPSSIGSASASAPPGTSCSSCSGAVYDGSARRPPAACAGREGSAESSPSSRESATDGRDSP